jgi:hypothetical protein
MDDDGAGMSRFYPSGKSETFVTQSFPERNPGAVIRQHLEAYGSEAGLGLAP